MVNPNGLFPGNASDVDLAQSLEGDSRHLPAQAFLRMGSSIEAAATIGSARRCL
jgi:hypothetical protein